MNSARSSPNPSPSVGTKGVQNHSPGYILSEILLDNHTSPSISSPRVCGLDVPLANHPFNLEPMSSPRGAINPAPPAHETAFTLVEPESLLLSYSDERIPPLQHSPPSPPSFPNPISDELCAINYSARFPPGHYLNPAFARVYLLGDELGSGGYGFVMTALHRRHGAEVAVKFVIKAKVPEQAWINHDTLGRIPVEIMLLRIINHENIVRCLDVFEDELFFYVVSLESLSLLIHAHCLCRFRNCTDLRGARERGHTLLTILRQRCRPRISPLPLHFYLLQRLNSLWPNQNWTPLLKCAVNFLLLISAFQTLQITTPFTISPFQKSTRAFT